MENEVKQQEQIKPPQDFQALIAGFFPTTKYFDSRFDLLQVQIDESRRNQEQIKEQIKDFKGDTDRRFEQAKDQLKDFKDDTDKRFEQVDRRFEQVDKHFEQVDKRFEQVDKRFEQVDHRFQRLEDKIDNLIERIDVKVDGGLKENRNLTVRLFTFALSFSLVAVVGMFGKLFGLF